MSTFGWREFLGLSEWRWAWRKFWELARPYLLGAVFVLGLPALLALAFVKPDAILYGVIPAVIIVVLLIIAR